MNTSKSVDDIVSFFGYLSARWEDERGYEPFIAYRKAAKDFVASEGGRYVRMSEEPFSLTFVLDGSEYKATVKEGGRVIDLTRYSS